ncbi:hypothetical protein [Paenibacillus sp. PDC88]|nr:hypothetical protein [Paenibacillus sp. PDC88]SDW22889.1 hypothetical protein SAMN05518848_101723 [Paenibacillus sp. PDC88]
MSKLTCNCAMKRDMAKMGAYDELLFLVDGRVFAVRLAKESEVEGALNK